jgi:hypothetical protein
MFVENGLFRVMFVFFGTILFLKIVMWGILRMFVKV